MKKIVLEVLSVIALIVVFAISLFGYGFAMAAARHRIEDMVAQGIDAKIIQEQVIMLDQGMVALLAVVFTVFLIVFGAFLIRYPPVTYGEMLKDE